MSHFRLIGFTDITHSIGPVAIVRANDFELLHEILLLRSSVHEAGGKPPAVIN
jgi:hypothetical protein